MIQSIFDGREKSQLNVIIDQNTDQCLKYALINAVGDSNYPTVLFCHQESEESYGTKLKILKRLFYVNHFEDLSWLSNSELSLGEVKSELLKSILNVTGTKDLSTATIFIDDIILFGRKHGFVNRNGDWDPRIFKTLVAVSEEVRVFLYVRPNQIPESHTRMLKHYSSFYARFIPAQTFPLAKESRCECVLRKNSGKIVSEILGFTIDNKQQLKFATLSGEVKQGPSSNESCESADPTSNLTFNLRLTDAERQAKSNTVLPYILNDDNKSAMLVGDGGRTAKGGGEIIYTPDDFDDFDDEDPDDDLDI